MNFAPLKSTLRRPGTGSLVAACTAAVLLLQACTTIQDLSESRDGARYKAGDTATANAGEIMLDRYQYSAAPVARPVAEIPGGDGRRAVGAGYPLVARKVDGERAFCTSLGSDFACFYDDDDDNRFDHVLVSNLGVASSKRPLVPGVAYTPGEGFATRGFKSELVYQGLADNVVNIRYRDYTDDLSRPTYEQDLHFELASKGPTEINYRAARIRILQADAQQIRYEVLSNFAEGG